MPRSFLATTGVVFDFDAALFQIQERGTVLEPDPGNVQALSWPTLGLTATRIARAGL